jgi:release factor glutamine methyltransferase
MQNPSRKNDSHWTILKILNWTTSYFNSYDIDSPRSTAEILLAHALKLKRIDLYLRYDQPLCGNELSRFKTLIKKRVNREPVAYIVGVKEFWSLNLSVTKDVLIPRPETECLVETALSLMPEDSNAHSTRRILELGTGSGAVIIALASCRIKNLFFASDVFTKSVAVAQDNAQCHALDGAINFFVGDWFSPFKKDKPLFDIILSNPPYVPTGLIHKLPPEIYKHEPSRALDGGKDGLFAIKHIIKNAPTYLNSDGYLLMEIGHNQKEKVIEIVNGCGEYEHVTFTKDYSGYNRVVQMKKNDRRSIFL